MLLKADNSENKLNKKTRLKVAAIQILRNALHEKTNMLIYLLRLLQDTFSKALPFVCLNV